MSESRVNRKAIADIRALCSQEGNDGPEWDMIYRMTEALESAYNLIETIEEKYPNLYTSE